MKNTVTKIRRVSALGIAVSLFLMPRPCLADDGFSAEGSLRLRGEYVDWYDQPQKRSDYDFLHSKLQLGLRYKHSDFELFGQARCLKNRVHHELKNRQCGRAMLVTAGLHRIGTSA